VEVAEPSSGEARFAQQHLYIGGAAVAAGSGQTFRSTNPATGELLALVDEADEGDVDRAVAAASAALKGDWGRMAPARRGDLLWKLAQLVEDQMERLLLLDVLDCGKPISDCRRIDGPGSVALLKYFAGAADKIRGAQVPYADHLNYTIREPYGVVGAIIPWNYPLYNAVLKLAPALSCGNTVVLKPSSQTPLSALALARLASDAGLPDGVVNVVPGRGSTAGERLAGHPDVPKITFTGSTEVGKRIATLAAGKVKSVTLELGGKAPNIIFADADLDAALAACLFSVFRNQGQTCSSGTRVLVHESIADGFIRRLAQRARGLKIGDPQDPTTKLGALVSSQQRELIESYVSQGLAEGARLVAGGKRPDDPALKGGYFFQPTIFDGVTMRMTIAREEIFGPVLSVLTFRDDDEAVAIAHDVVYGLSAALWTRDIGRAHRIARQLDVGIVWINTIHAGGPGSPSAGRRQSGVGVERGLEALDDLTRVKSVWVGLDPTPINWDR
jgi:acyl-CoA reductase-like NAD-dependent aldehyde dehydrogenase